jgi:hypothetical protein
MSTYFQRKIEIPLRSNIKGRGLMGMSLIFNCGITLGLMRAPHVYR